MFMAVAEVGSFSAAARRLGVTPSAVSKGVARLEGGLGVRLLARSTRHVNLTAEGTSFRDRCRPILSDLAEARDEILMAGAAPAGRLRVSLPTSMSQLKFIPALPRFLALYPAIQIDINVTDRPVDLIGEGIDVAIRVGEMGDSRLIARKLWQPAYVTCASPAYLARKGTPQTIEDLVDHQCLGRFVDHMGRVRNWVFRREGATFEWEPRGQVTIDRVEGLATAAMAGLGIIHLNHYVVEEDLKAGRLLQILGDYASPGPPIQAVMVPGRQHVPRVRAFVDFAVSLFATCTNAD